jgi:hypothetical protein
VVILTESNYNVKLLFTLFSDFFIPTTQLHYKSVNYPAELLPSTFTECLHLGQICCVPLVLVVCVIITG